MNFSNSIVVIVFLSSAILGIPAIANSKMPLLITLLVTGGLEALTNKEKTSSGVNSGSFKSKNGIKTS